MIHKTADLTGALLDAAVAKAEGLPVHPGRDFIVAETIDVVYAHEIQPSWLWEHAGKIIERERIWTGYCDESSPWSGMWFAQYGEDNPNYHQIGETPLIAAMRAYVLCKLGPEVDL